MTLTVIHCGSSKVIHLCALLAQFGLSYQVVPLTVANSTQFDCSDGVIISGGPHLFTDQTGRASLLQQFAFIDQLTIPTLGICLGHQAIGLRSGASIYLGEARRDTDVINIRRSHPLVRGLPPNPVFSEDHCEGITVPEEFVLIGSSHAYPVEIIASATRPCFGVQFHPEVSGKPGQVLLRNFIAIVMQHKMGIASLSCESPHR